MKRKLLNILTILIVATLLIAPQSATKVGSAPIGNNILSRALDIEMGLVQPEKYEMPISSGALYALLQGSGELARRADQAAAMSVQSLSVSSPSQAKTQGCQNVFTGGGKRNTRVNQDCSLRRQAEEVIAINPTNNKNLIAGQNDSRVGFNHCGYAWSFDGGKTWGDQVPPFYGLINLGGSTFDACSDPTATFDSQGNAYVGGVLFMLNYPDSAFAVATHHEQRRCHRIDPPMAGIKHWHPGFLDQHRRSDQPVVHNSSPSGTQLLPVLLGLRRRF